METEMKEMNEKIGENPFKDDDNFDEPIQIQIRKERTTESYKDNRNGDIETIKKMRILNKYFKKLNGAQYMRLWINIISKIQIYFRMLLSKNVKNFQTNHKTYRVM